MEHTIYDDIYHMININETHTDDDIIDNKIKHVIMLQEQERDTLKKKTCCCKCINYRSIINFFWFYTIYSII